MIVSSVPLAGYPIRQGGTLAGIPGILSDSLYYICRITTTTDMDKIIHQGRNVKRFREMLGIKQEGLAYMLGDDWNQKKISGLEQKEVIDDPLLEQVAKLLKVPADAIKNFDEEAAINVIGNSYHDNSTSNVNYHCTFNPIDKIVELYEALVKSEKEKVELLQKVLDEKNNYTK
jgi:transcriptional regulator with XRE-family HTH domain